MPDRSELECDLEGLLNGYEDDSNTPDFILASYMRRALDNFNETLQAREKWYGRPIGFGDFT